MGFGFGGTRESKVCGYAAQVQKDFRHPLGTALNALGCPEKAKAVSFDTAFIGSGGTI